MLFEDHERTFMGPKSHGESDWGYLNRSGRIEAQKIREFLNSWVLRYPSLEQGELIRRMQAGNDQQFQSAFFELFIFALLRSIGCTVVVHPDLQNGSSKRPDFLAITPEGESVYIEAVMASDYNKATVAARRRTDAVLDAIEQINSPNFIISVQTEGHPEVPPNGRRMRRELTRWLDQLDPDVVTHEVSEMGGELPVMYWQDEGWDVTFEAIPKRPECRGYGQKNIGYLSHGGGWLNVWEPIRDAVKSKGGRYGTLSYPLIVAVNVDAIFVERIDEMQGLFGQEAYVFNREDISAPPQMIRKPNGAWYGPRGPQYTRVSAAWMFDSVNPWNQVRRNNTLYFNPWAVRPLPPLFSSVNHAKNEKDKMNWNDGRSLRDILQLPEDWPN